MSTPYQYPAAPQTGYDQGYPQVRARLRRRTRARRVDPTPRSTTSSSVDEKK
jgi:hypothetical protein